MRQTTIYALREKNGPIRYVGKTVGPLLSRLKSHKREAVKNAATHKDRWIKQQIKASNEIEIFALEVCDADWQSREQFWIREGRLKGWPLTNISDGGDGPVGYHHSIEARRKISEANRGTHKRAGKKLTPEHQEALLKSIIGREKSAAERESISRRMKNKIVSTETRQKMSLAKKGKPSGRVFSQVTRQKMSLSKRGKTWSAERKLAASKSRKGRVASPETRQKISLAMKGRNIGVIRSDATKARISASKKGKPSNRKGVTLSDATKLKMRERFRRKREEAYQQGDISHVAIKQGERVEDRVI